MKQGKILSVTMMCGVLAACATAGHQRTVDTSCTAFRTISYAEIAKRVLDELPLVDVGNVADTPATVKEIESHNAVVERLCPPGAP